MPELAIFFPVLGRPQNAERAARDVARHTRCAHNLYFICSPSDEDQIAACQATSATVFVADWEPGRADWAKKLELARANTTEPYMLLGADDLHFHNGWDAAVLHAFEMYDVGVVGTQDGGNELVKKGQHSTHPVVCRGYVDKWGTIDDPKLMLHQGYDHQFADNELVETAMSRGCWYFADDAYVEHLHPVWGKGKQDATYQKAYRREREDRRLFMRRRRLWQRPAFRRRR